jgi:single-stranded-DNA-specific exonuclease
MPVRAIKRRRPRMDDCGLPDQLHPVLRRIYAQRGIASPRQLETSLAHLVPAQRLSGMQAAVELLASALESRQRILVIGDFDADGATSTALAIRAMRAMGATDVQYKVPNRFEYGYGLTPEIVEDSLARAPDVIITVDNGVSSIEGVALARRHGIRVLVTDHHLPGETLPEADVIVNPNLPGDEFPSKVLAGVGVIFYVMLSLRSHLRHAGWFESTGVAEPNMARYLDLVALGTVADVVALDHNNRIMVEQGLRRIRAGHCIVGISALLDVAGRNQNRTVSSDLGFAVGPRLNAAGRLEDMSIGIECLLTDDRSRALELASQLDRLNRQRREIESKMQDEALGLVQRTATVLDAASLPEGICLYDERWHQGVIGILASRIKERFHRPVIAFADAGNGELKGSARSISGLHIRDLLDQIATSHPGLISKFGGHAMAAGLSLGREQFMGFQDAFVQATRRHMSENQLDDEIYSDGELSHEDLNLEIAELIRNAGPWGQGFPEPQFDGVFEIVERRRVGGRHMKLSLKTQGVPTSIDAIMFNHEARGWRDGLETVHIVYRLDVNEYQHNFTAQIVVTHLNAESES